MGTVNELLTVARQEIGNKESPAGSNMTKYGKWYGWNGVPWCLIFIMWVFAQIGVSLPKRTASCGDLMRAAQAAGSWVVSNFQPGDVVIFDFSGKRSTTQHCGIVESVLPDFGVQSIEGNTSSGDVGSQNNGGGVFRRRRAQKYIIGAVRPKFEEEPMSGKEIYDALNAYLKTQPVPAWAAAEIEEAKKMGLTDGSDLMTLIPRYQAVILAKRAAQK